jgi:ribonucleoside-diphosphate reductase alpha chain
MGGAFMSAHNYIEDFLTERYYRGDEDWYSLITRVSKFLGNNKKEILEFYFMMVEKNALPSSPILMNAGFDGFMSACSYLPVEDDLEGIMQTISKAVMIQKFGGGTGFNFSKLRPKGSHVKKTNGVASGPCSFIKMYDACSDVIKQGGKRRGANMALLHYKHPDIQEFLHMKDKKGITNFNLSVILDDEAFKDNSLIKKIAKRIWTHGEPGCIFWDRVLEDEPFAEGINPCGEIPLRAYESCVLGSINLYNHIDGKAIDHAKLARTTKTMVKLLNRVIDKNNYPYKEMKKAALKTRKIGLGIMGFADTLFRLGMLYGSDECLNFIDEIMGTITRAAFEVEEGNFSMFSIAPTGSISIIADVSSGIEPVFAFKYAMKREKGEYIIPNRTIRDMGLDEKSLPKHFKTAHELSPYDHIKVQAQFQKWVDQAISKTINLPAEITEDEIENLIRFAHDERCKGIAMFRDDCKRDSFLEEIKYPECDTGSCDAN